MPIRSRWPRAGLALAVAFLLAGCLGGDPIDASFTIEAMPEAGSARATGVELLVHLVATSEANAYEARFADPLWDPAQPQKLPRGALLRLDDASQSVRALVPVDRDGRSTFSTHSAVKAVVFIEAVGDAGPSCHLEGQRARLGAEGVREVRALYRVVCPA